MAKYLLGIVSGLFLAVFLALFVGIIIWAVDRGGEMSAPSDSALLLELSGGIPEHIDTDFTLEMLASDGSRPVTLYGLTAALKKAAADDDIRALILNCRGFSAGWAKAQEIRWAIDEFKESGKPVWAFLTVGGTLDYYVASMADKVVIQPESVLDVKGLRAEISFFKETFDKLGIAAEMENVGKYKSAVEPYSRTGMSDEFREVTDALLDDLYLQLLTGFAKGRGRDADHWREVIDNGPFLSAQAKQYGLVDDVLYEDEFHDQLNAELGVEELNKVRLASYVGGGFPTFGGRKIAMVHAVGTILSGRSRSDPFSGERVIGSRSFVKTLNEVREDEDIDAVILRINSPGGDAIASDQMLRAVRRLREEKPLVISMSNLAASGGYYIAAAEDTKIVAYPGTYTGSIGVYFGKFSLGGLYEKIGLNKEVLTRGRFAAIDTDSRTLTPDERAKLRESVESVYQTFVTRVSEARDDDFETIHEIAQGRVWLGSQALENGLIDEIGGFGRAIELAKEAADIGDDETVNIISYPPPRHLLDVLLQQNGFARSDPVLTALRSELGEFSGLPALMRGGVLRLMPYTVTVR